MTIVDFKTQVADSEIDPVIARDSEVSAAIATHEAKTDPHIGYVKKSGDTMSGGLQIGSNPNGNVWSNSFKVNGGTIPTAAGSEVRIASFLGVTGGNHAGLGVTLYKTSAVASWSDTSVILGYDVDNSKSVGGYLSIFNGKIGINKALPTATLDIAGDALLTGRVLSTGGLSASASMATVNGSLGAFEARSLGSGAGAGAAFMCFHRPGSFATYLGLDTDNQLKVGGWSYGNAAYKIWHEANLNFDNLPATALSRGTLTAPTSSGLVVKGAGTNDLAFMTFSAYDGNDGGYKNFRFGTDGYGSLLFNGNLVQHDGLYTTRLRSWSKTNLPPGVSTPGQLIYVSDATGGGRVCYSDGQFWRRVDTNAVVS